MLTLDPGWKRPEGQINVPARWPVPDDNIDIHNDAVTRGSYDYLKYSMNYVVDLGPVDVYHLHRYGGDADFGRRSGLDWLKLRLHKRGFTRPVIIVQHFPFVGGQPEGLVKGDPGWDWKTNWTFEQRDHLLEILLPYNVLALCGGHHHDPGQLYDWYPTFYNNKETMDATYTAPKTCFQLRPGAAFNNFFGVVRVSTGANGVKHLNYIQGTAGNDGVGWDRGATTMMVDTPPQLYVRGFKVSNIVNFHYLSTIRLVGWRKP
jgi:cytolysin (calcineurin-like family phosphatase)